MEAADKEEENGATTPTPTTQTTTDKASSDRPPPQYYLFVIRHGDRWDYANPDTWQEQAQTFDKRTGDSPLSTLGHRQAREAGMWLDDWMSSKRLTAADLIWTSSPFLRCLQTSDDALNAFAKIDTSTTPILVEDSIFEWDGHGGEWHADLPSLTKERHHYFPRIDLSYRPLFTPTLPEPRSAFLERCQRSVDALMQRYYATCDCNKNSDDENDGENDENGGDLDQTKQQQRPKVLVLVSHAAGCIGLAKALTGKELTDITPAGPCSIYGFTRSCSATKTAWHLDDHDAPQSLNGYTDHISVMGDATKPWNDFGNGTAKFYTGPATSRYAPSSSSSSS